LIHKALKKDTANKRGTSLILVPCWWDGTQERYAEEGERRKGRGKEGYAEEGERRKEKGKEEGEGGGEE
jgi:hypothetical protein